MGMDAGCSEPQSLSPDMLPYQMNCEPSEVSAIETLSSIFYDKQQGLANESAALSNSVSEQSEMCCGSIGSADEFDFDQSYRRILQNADIIRPGNYLQQESFLESEYQQLPPTQPHQELPKEVSQDVAFRSRPERDLEMEKELRRQRNNEASRRSRREKKRRFLEIERRVEEIKASNKRLSEFVVELESIIEEAKSILLAVRSSGVPCPPVPAEWETKPQI